MRAAYQGADRKRLSLTDMEMIRNTNAPVIASPAAYGFGPSVAMPAILGMMPDNPNLDETEGSGEGEESVIRYLEEAQKHFTPQVYVCILLLWQVALLKLIERDEAALLNREVFLLRDEVTLLNRDVFLSRDEVALLNREG